MNRWFQRYLRIFSLIKLYNFYMVCIMQTIILSVTLVKQQKLSVKYSANPPYNLLEF